jgi:hypothetical protein
MNDPIHKDPQSRRKEAKKVHLYVAPAPGDGAGTQVTILLTDETGHRAHWEWIGTRLEAKELLISLREQADQYLQPLLGPRIAGKHEDLGAVTKVGE